MTNTIDYSDVTLEIGDSDGFDPAIKKLLTPVPAVRLVVPPYGLNRLMWRVLDNQIDLLIRNSNTDIGQHLAKYLRKTQQLHNVKLALPSQTVGTWTPALRRSVIKRAAICNFSRFFYSRCACLVTSSPAGEWAAVSTCLPAGMAPKGHRYCRGIYCPNCYMRRAAKISSVIANNFPKSSKNTFRAITVGLNVQAQSTVYGFNFNQDDITNTIGKKLSSRLKNIQFNAIKTMGVTVRDRHPFLCSRFAIFVNEKDEGTVLGKLQKLKSKLFAEDPNMHFQFSVEEGIDNIVFNLYDCPPLSLAGVADDGVHNSQLQHTVDSFRISMQNKKRLLIFGTGAEIERQDD